ncbi:transient receptor potential cation channel subfamily V member 6-like isoform X2 [Stegostoma tigrinum]|uniref:transient receptor potential cation channel subfamily V member 6-like isoform X2 n=1 Tax=Stegostoma tigrinum TaxID=3053191 RepID=UPI0028708F76|nr:transient receptor potential cation channel subfamily V member 6-like isoform X2 [Stegostoma tigrinum]
MPGLFWGGWRSALLSALRGLVPDLQSDEEFGPEVSERHVRQQKRINESLLLFAAKENRDQDIFKLAHCPSFNPLETGILGETALHVAAVYNANRAAIALLDVAPELMNISISGELYAGETALHIVAANGNVQLVKELISRQADVVTPRATGTFFRKDSKSIIYYGEHVLSFAACVGNAEIVRFLIENGADIRAQDYLGNTVLHVLVLQPKRPFIPQMYDTILSYDKAQNEPAVDMIVNRNGLTPIKLAVVEGNIQMFQHLLQRKEHNVHRPYGPLISTYYDLLEIDSWNDDLSVLQLVISSKNKEALKIFRLSPMKELLRLKWNSYGMYYFRLLAFLYLVYITIFTFCCAYRPLKPRPENATNERDSMLYVERTLQESYVTYEDRVRLVGEIVSVLGAVIIVLLESHDILRYGPKEYFGKTALGGPFHLINICYGVLVLAVLVLRLTSMPGETIPMSFALILAWCNLMYFARGFRLMGPFTIMIQKIIFEIILPYLVLMLILILAFTCSVHLSFQILDPAKWERFVDFSTVLFNIYLLFFGLVNMPLNWEVIQPDMARFLYAVYTLLAFVITVFLVIHIMGELIRRVSKQHDDLWRAQVASTTLLLERRLPRCLFPRLGICGKEYGLGDSWYLRVDDRNDNAALQIHTYNEDVDAKGCDGRLKKGGTLDKSERWHRPRQGWQMVRHRKMGQNCRDLYNESNSESCLI